MVLLNLGWKSPTKRKARGKNIHRRLSRLAYREDTAGDPATLVNGIDVKLPNEDEEEELEACSCSVMCFLLREGMAMDCDIIRLIKEKPSRMFAGSR